MRKLIAILLAMVMVLSLTVPAMAAEEAADATVLAAAPAQLEATDIVILHTNDVHTYIGNPLSYDVIAGVKQELLKQTPNVILVDAGDHIQGTAYGSMDKGKTIIDLMNAAGYDAATLGNHEFDYGMEGRINVTDSWAQYPYLSCNFYNEANGERGENVLDSYKIFTFGEEKVALIGMTTPETFTKSTPAYFQDDAGNYIYGISGGEDGTALYADVQKAIDEAKADHIVSTICSCAINGSLHVRIQRCAILAAGNAINIVSAFILEIGGSGLGEGLRSGDAHKGYSSVAAGKGLVAI